MKDKTIGWKMYETIGVSVVNPIVFVYDMVKKRKNTTTSENIRTLFKECLARVPHRPGKVLEIIENQFPELKEELSIFKLLL